MRWEARASSSVSLAGHTGGLGQERMLIIFAINQGCIVLTPYQRTWVTSLNPTAPLRRPYLAHLI